MKAELVKRQDRWDLYGEDGSKIASSAPNPFKRLSIKNCQAISGVYDLDELAYGYAETQHQAPHVFLSYIKHYKEGFQKALEIKSDKKFSKYDMLDFAEFFMNLTDKSKPFQKLKDWESLQQNEWEVEIEMNIIPELLKGSYPEEKLDENGCLILKRKV